MLIIQLVLIQVTTFIFIVLFIRWLLHGQISKAVKRLRKLNRENMEREKELKKESEKAKREIEREITEGKAEAERIKQEVKEEAERKRKKALEEAKEKANRIVEEGRRDLQRNKKEFILDMENKAVLLAAKMTGYIFTEKASKNFHSQFVDEVIGELEGLPQDKLQSEGSQAEICSTYPLSQQQKAKIKDILSRKLEKDIELKEKIEEELIAGLVIKLGGFAVIDGSIQGRLNKILPKMKEEAKKL